MGQGRQERKNEEVEWKNRSLPASYPSIEDIKRVATASRYMLCSDDSGNTEQHMWHMTIAAPTVNASTKKGLTKARFDSNAEVSSFGVTS